MPASSSRRSRPLKPTEPTSNPRGNPAPPRLSSSAAKTGGAGARSTSSAAKIESRPASRVGAAAPPRRNTTPLDETAPAKSAPGKSASHRLSEDRRLTAVKKGTAKPGSTPSVKAGHRADKGTAIKPAGAKTRAGQDATDRATSTKAGTARKRELKTAALPGASGAPVNATRARRPRVPADFAAQYGESAKPRKIKSGAAGAVTERRARRDAAARERLRQIMTPDDDLLRRLSRAGAIAASVSNGAADDGHLPKRAATRSVRRPRSWESRCGKCGVATVFKVAAGICARCGAIALRTMNAER